MNIETNFGVPFFIQEPRFGVIDILPIELCEDGRIRIQSIALPWANFYIPGIAKIVDWIDETESPINVGCTCDFRGANCWLGCRCGATKEAA